MLLDSQQTSPYHLGKELWNVYLKQTSNTVSYREVYPKVKFWVSWETFMA